MKTPAVLLGAVVVALSLSSGDLKGFYSAYVPFSESDQVVLKRIDR